MDAELLFIGATERANIVWARLIKIGYKVNSQPIIVINKRLKTTAGMCYHEERSIELSYELFAEHWQTYMREIIPHELAHQVDWDHYGKAGHGPTWKGIMQNLGLPPTRCHRMKNSLHEAKKAARIKA